MMSSTVKNIIKIPQKVFEFSLKSWTGLMNLCEESDSAS